MRPLALLLMMALSSEVLACGKETKPPVNDVVFDLIEPESAELDNQLRAMYECKYAFAMLLSPKGYERMHRISGAMPETPAGADGKPIAGIVLVGFILEADGTPSDPVILKSADERLSKIALGHVTTLKYQPSKFNGKVVRALGVQVYEFK
jgi:hypothetical protein